MWKIVLVLCFFLSISQCFNINIENTKMFKGDAGSQFGFRLKFHKPSPDHSDLNLLVSAPKDSVPISGVQAGGSVRYCYNVLSDDSDCSETKDQSMKNPVRSNENGYVDEGFGFTLSASNKIYMSCAPRWKDTLSAVQFGYTFMLGRCRIGYFSDRRPRDLAVYFNSASGGALYLRDAEYFHGLAAFGFSSDVTEETIVVVGAPGLSVFEGGIYISDVVAGEASETSPAVFVNTINTTAHGYEGYDVKFGHLCDRAICLASGAPNLYKSGRVFLYKWENKERLVKLQTLEGENNWSYFGSVLCPVNVDADSYDELLIGAPLYTDVHDYTGGLDLGRVYIYKRNEDSQQYELEFSLDGSRSSHSRFGSAIESIGSINLDEFKDVIVGAPGEEDGMGCVYIYLGSGLGLSREYSQRICASQLSADTGAYQGFGLAFSGPVYLKESSYPMFAVGSPLSDTVTLFECRPIVDMTASLKANPNPITMPSADDNVGEISTTVTLCLNFTIHTSKKEALDFTVEFEIDTQITEETSKRAVFVASNGNLEYRLTRSLPNNLNSPICVDYKAQIKKDKFLRSRFTPIEVVAKYHLNEKSGSGPVHNMKDKKEESLIFTFTNDCGSDEVCKVDLKVTGQLVPSHAGGWDHIVVNHTSELAAVIGITNSGETSYWTQIQVHVDQPFTYLDFKSSHIKNCDPYDTDVVSSEINIICNYYQPLVKDAAVELILTFDTENFNLDKESVKVSVDAIPKYEINNPEVNPDDNSVFLTMPIFIVAPVRIDGISSPAEVAVSRVREISPIADADIDMNNIQWKSFSEGMKLNHKLQIQNQGPSFLPKTEIFLSVPIFLPDTTQLVTSLSVELSVSKEKTIKCFSSEQSGSGKPATQKPPSSTTGSDKTKGITSSSSVITTSSKEEPPTTTNPFVGGISRRKRSASNAEEQSAKTYMLSCENDSKYCKTYKCQLPVNLPPSGHTEINVTLTIDENNIAMPEDYSVFELMLHTTVSQPNHKLFKEWTSEQDKMATTHTKTVFHLVKSGGQINLWIIIVSIAGGLVLIFLITILFWKCGFFKREKHYQVEKWKRESQRKSQREASDGQQNGEDI